jgi:RNA polymerase sigma factor (TIGR02999 family)
MRPAEAWARPTRHDNNEEKWKNPAHVFHALAVKPEQYDVVQRIMPRHRVRTDGSVDAHLQERRALDELFAARYKELRRIASNLKRHDGNVTLSPTALVNEAWLRLAGSPQVGTLSAAHFKAIAAQAMRRVLTDAARRRTAQKRAAAGLTIAFDESIEDRLVSEESVRELDAALHDLARLEPRQSALVEARYFGGLTVPELAELLDISVTTVERDWRVAKAWLKSQLRRR